MNGDTAYRYRLQISEKSFSDGESLQEYFNKEFLWAKGQDEIISLTDMIDERDYPIDFVEGVFEGKKLAYAVCNYSKAILIYIERHKDFKKMGFADEMLCYLLHRMPKDKNVEASMPYPHAEPLLKRFRFEPSFPENYKPGDKITLWVKKW